MGNKLCIPIQVHFPKKKKKHSDFEMSTITGDSATEENTTLDFTICTPTEITLTSVSADSDQSIMQSRERIKEYKNRKSQDSGNATPFTTIDEFIENVRPFDLIVFKGGGIISKLITTAEIIGRPALASNVLDPHDDVVSHVGFVITQEFCPCVKIYDGNDDPRRPLIWESTSSGSQNDSAVDLETGRGFVGTQLRDLRKVVEQYIDPKCGQNGRVGWCRIINNPIDVLPNETPEQYQHRMEQLRVIMNGIHSEYNHVNYDAVPTDLLSAVFTPLKGLRNIVEHHLSKVSNADKWLFCSEFVATVYIAAGILKASPQAQIIQARNRLGLSIEAAPTGGTDPRDISPNDLMHGSPSEGIVNIVKPAIWVKK